MTAMFPNLYTDHETNKRAFYSSVDEKAREIEDGEKTLERLRR